MIEGMAGRSPTARHPPPAARRFTRTSLAITAMHTAILAGRAPHHVTRRGVRPRPLPLPPRAAAQTPPFSTVALPCLSAQTLMLTLSCQARSPPLLLGRWRRPASVAPSHFSRQAPQIVSLSLAGPALTLRLGGVPASLAALPVLRPPRPNALARLAEPTLLVSQAA